MPYADPKVEGAVFVVLAVVAAAIFLVGRRLPKERKFRCAGCSAWTAHTNRTIEAWRLGKTRLYCGTCHAHWLKTHPAVSTARSRFWGKEARSGCLGAFVVMVGVPLVAAVSWWLYA